MKRVHSEKSKHHRKWHYPAVQWDVEHVVTTHHQFRMPSGQRVPVSVPPHWPELYPVTQTVCTVTIATQLHSLTDRTHQCVCLETEQARQGTHRTSDHISLARTGRHSLNLLADKCNIICHSSVLHITAEQLTVCYPRTNCDITQACMKWLKLPDHNI